MGFFSDAWLSNITYYVYSLPQAEQHLNKDSSEFKEFETNFCNDVSSIVECLAYAL